MNDINTEPFYCPLGSFIIKSDPQDEHIIYLEASNEEPDTQKEVVFMKALEQEAESYLTKGIVSWDHLHKIEGDPKYIIGEPLDVKFSNSKTFVKARLYEGVEMAESVRRLAKANSTKLGASIGGFIRKREPVNDSLSGISGVMWDEVAITYKPVNSSTMGRVSLIPMEVFNKALMAGSGINPAEFSGGRALIGESLQGADGKKAMVEVVEELVQRLAKGDIRTDDDFKEFLDYKNVPFLYGALKEVVTKKFKES